MSPLGFVDLEYSDPQLELSTSFRGTMDINQDLAGGPGNYEMIFETVNNNYGATTWRIAINKEFADGPDDTIVFNERISLESFQVDYPSAYGTYFTLAATSLQSAPSDTLDGCYVDRNFLQAWSVGER